MIDLRSDTVTRPTPAMREVMARAQVGDDVYGEDPTINELEARAAELTGKGSALYVPSGSQANLIAQMALVRRGDEVVCGAVSHCIAYEVGAGAALAGVQYQVIPGDGLFTADQARAVIKPPTFHTPGTGLVWIENTHNRAGGKIFPADEIGRVGELCEEQGLPLHVDGARVFNASVATGAPVDEIVAPATTVSFCLSKGLGAPVGSLLCGPGGDFRDRALRLRKMLGGGMRQAGILAAAGLYALDNHVERLADDHRRARELAGKLAPIDGLSVDRDAVETNIVNVETEPPLDAATLVAGCKERGLLFGAIASHKVRLVTHLDVDDRAIDEAATILEEVARSVRASA
jgi:threonine aldolase